MINKIWFYIIFAGIIYAIFTNNITVLNQEILNSGKKTIDILMFLVPSIALWSGLMQVAQDSTLLDKLTSLISYPLLKIFPDLTKEDKALNYISSSIIFNLFGLGNAATPSGLKAMQLLQEKNPHKEIASNSMITFLVLVTTGLSLVPTTIIALRQSFGSTSPESIILPTFIASLTATIIALLVDRIFYDKSK